jgi:hypothetical protein
MAADDSFDPLMTFRPRIAGKRRESDPHRVPLLSVDLRRRLRGLPTRPGAAPKPARRGIAGVAEPGPLSRRCVVKAHYVSAASTSGDGLRLHLAYLERDGVEKDGSPGVLYGQDTTFDKATFAELIPGEKRQFRFIVAPEDGAELDLTSFARELMTRMSEDLGRPLIWAAVNHHNTEHDHVHIVIRGIDGTGRELFIPDSYIKRDMRWRAQEIATRELGLRSEVDFRKQRNAEISKERLTTLDRRLKELVAGGQQLPARALGAVRQHERPALLARLATLKSLGLAHAGAWGTWTLVPDWQERLRALGERADVIKRLHRIAGGDVSRYRLDGATALAAPVEGVVRGKGLHDELAGSVFAAIESKDGATHYVLLDDRTAAALEPGDIVRAVPSVEPWVKPTDKVLAKVAGAAGGLYDPKAHLAQLDAAHRPPDAPAPAVLVAGNVRRLERLEHYGLVRRQGTAWRIPADLIAQLEARERSHPRRRLRVEYCGADLRTQATYPGPTWLDRQAAAPDGAPWGFGAELRRAVEDRAAYLRSRGLDPRGGSLTAEQLEASERTLLMRQLARDLGPEAAAAPLASGLRGVLRTAPPLPSGRAVAYVVDERSKRFAVVDATPETTRLTGRLVDVSVGAGGYLNVRPARPLARGESE